MKTLVHGAKLSYLICSISGNVLSQGFEKDYKDSSVTVMNCFNTAFINIKALFCSHFNKSLFPRLITNKVFS